MAAESEHHQPTETRSTYCHLRAKKTMKVLKTAGALVLATVTSTSTVIVTMTDDDDERLIDGLIDGLIADSPSFPHRSL